MAGKFVWTQRGAAAQSYTFPVHFSFGYEAPQVELDFYENAALGKNCTALWYNDFNFVMVAPGLWSGTIELQEI